MLIRILKIINYKPRVGDGNGGSELEASWECLEWALLMGEELPPWDNDVQPYDK